MAAVKREHAKPKTRSASGAIVRVVINMHGDEDEPPGYSGHNNGSFGDAGYRAGTGGFGFKHDVVARTDVSPRG